MPPKNGFEMQRPDALQPCHRLGSCAFAIRQVKVGQSVNGYPRRNLVQLARFLQRQFLPKSLLGFCFRGIRFTAAASLVIVVADLPTVAASNDSEPSPYFARCFRNFQNFGHASVVLSTLKKGYYQIPRTRS